jgi:peptide/nickel transport system substrate-binding protein
MSGSTYRQHFEQRRISRRRVLTRAATALGASALALAGCSTSDKTAPAHWTPSPQDTPRSGGTPIFAIPVDPGSLDPQLNVISGYLSARIHNPLHAVNMSTLEVQPLVAESLEYPDRMTYVWKLRQGVKFHDIDPTFGREVKAADVVYSFDRLKAGPTLNDRKLVTLHTDRYEAVDDHTFSLRTNKLYSPTVDHTGGFAYSIVPHEAVDKWGGLDTQASGCGAWILDNYVRAERVTLRRNPDYFQRGRPFPDGEEWLPITDLGTLWQTFKTGHADYVGVNLDKLKRAEIEGNPEFQIAEAPQLFTINFYTRVDRPPFSDERVREAMDIGFDRDDVINKMYFGEGNFNGPIPWPLEYWALPQDELRRALAYDPERAKQLLDAAGYGDGMNIDMPVAAFGDSPKIATILADQYAKLGVKVSIRPRELGAFLAQELYGHNFDMAVFLNLPYMEPDIILRSYYSKGQQADVNPGLSNDPEVDGLIEGIWSIFDLEEKRQAVLDCQRVILKKHGPMYPFVSPEGYAGFSSKMRGLQEGTGLIGWMGVSYWVEES